MIIHVDFETYSSADIKNGAYRYAAHVSTGIWLMAWAVDNGEVKIWYPGDPVPKEFFTEGVMFSAHNVMFERCIWSRIAVSEYGFPPFDIRQWHCTKALAAYYQLPCKGTSLEKVAKALGCQHQKDKEGSKLMKRRAKPRTSRTLFGSEDDFEVQRLAVYCVQDVRAQREVSQRLGHYLPEVERQVWLLDQEINFRGIRVDKKLCESAIRIRDTEAKKFNLEIEKLTGGAVLAATQVKQIAKWIASKGVYLGALDEETIHNTLLSDSCPPDVRRLLEIRQLTSLISLAKYDKMLQLADDSGRMRDCIEYHGAGPGRWAGRGAQIQNFPRGEGEDSDGICDCILRGIELLELFYGDDLLSTLKGGLRGALMAKDEYTLAIWDYAQIEARVLAWLANEQLLLKGFRDKADVYKMFAAEIYRTPVSSVTKPQRFVGKTAVLGLGYSMGGEKFQASLDSPNGGYTKLSLPECKRIVSVYRSTFPRIVALWDEIDRLWRKAVATGKTSSFGGVLEFGYVKAPWGNAVTIKLPSGRKLFYWGAEAKDGRGQYQKHGFAKHVYGGLLVENIVQGIARDIMAAGMIRLRSKCDLVATVHDEIISEVPEDRSGELLAYGYDQLSIAPEWAIGLPLAVEGFVSKRYRK
jgi:DNA polymerase